MKNPDLWDRLQAHQFDAPGATQPFSVKLALAEGWDADHTAEVIEEYRWFLYLTQVADGQVTPSIAVDKAWHMHLTFTRDYWERLCPDVLGQPLHHEPCAGPEEMPRYHRQFDQTRDLYREEFGTPPPAHIWGEERPAQQSPEHPPKRLAYAGLYGISAIIVLAFLDPNIVIAIGAIGAIAAIALAVVNGNRKKKRKDGSGCSPGGGGCGAGCGGRSSKGEGTGADSSGDGGGGCGGGGCGGGGG